MSESTWATKCESLSQVADVKRSRSELDWLGKRGERGSVVGRIFSAPSAFQSVVFTDRSISLHKQIESQTVALTGWNKKNHILSEPPRTRECDISYYYNTLKFVAKPVAFSRSQHGSHPFLNQTHFSFLPETISQSPNHITGKTTLPGKEHRSPIFAFLCKRSKILCQTIKE
jgi:hypothetical protein